MLTPRQAMSGTSTMAAPVGQAGDVLNTVSIDIAAFLACHSSTTPHVVRLAGRLCPRPSRTVHTRVALEVEDVRPAEFNIVVSTWDDSIILCRPRRVDRLRLERRRQPLTVLPTGSPVSDENPARSRAPASRDIASSAVVQAMVVSLALGDLLNAICPRHDLRRKARTVHRSHHHVPDSSGCSTPTNYDAGGR